MKILVVHNRYLQQGGEDSAVQSDVQLLRERGHEVITYFRDNEDLKSLTNLTLAGETIWSARAKADVERLITLENPDIVHAHNTLPLISPSIYYGAKAAGVPVVQTLHNYRLVCPAATFVRDGRICEDCLGKSVPWPSVLHSCYRGSRPASAAVAGMLTFHRAKSTYTKQVDRFIALTSFAKRKFVEGGLPEAKFSVRGNFLAQDPGLGTGSRKYGLYVGRLSEEKGVDVLIDAWRELPHHELKIVGDGPLMPNLRQRASDLPNVHFLGQLSRIETIEKIKEAAALILPSICYEGFPMTIVEAFAVGTPVVASDLGSMAEIVEDQQSGLLVKPGDPRAWSTDLAAVLSNPQLLGSLRIGARRSYEKTHSADVAYSKLSNIYDSLLS